MLNIRRSNRRIRKSRDEFWAKEIRANSVRRKPLDNVDFLAVPYDELPFDLEKDDDVIKECTGELLDLKEEPIANFTGITNTDLKLEYGAPNITTLSKADTNYTLLVRNLQKWAERLHELGPSWRTAANSTATAPPKNRRTPSRSSSTGSATCT